jgi:hypothetical protein
LLGAGLRPKNIEKIKPIQMLENSGNWLNS